MLASFERSCYLETAEGRLIAVLAEPLGRGPFAITLQGTPSFADLQPSQAVSLAEGLLDVHDFRIDIDAAEVWDPTVPSLTGPADEGMLALYAHLRAHAPVEGLARVNLDADVIPQTPLLDQGTRALWQLGDGLIDGHAPTISAASVQLAGLGPGLTPSGDDVLAGVFLALHVWPEAAGTLGGRFVTALLLGAAAPRTGRISRAYLLASSRGQASAPWHDLIRTLPANSDAVIRAASRIMEVGETSGGDMLRGFIALWEISGAMAYRPQER